jgi:hypothetical protein
MVGPGQKAGHAAQQRNEARDKHSFAAVAQKEILADLDAGIVS